MILPSRELMPLIRAALKRGQRVRMTVNGSSMFPFIYNNDSVELAPISAPPQVGDILLAQNTGGCYLVHRVIRVKGENFYLRGNFQRDSEGPFNLEHIFGKVIQSDHRGQLRNHPDWNWHILGLIWVYTHPVGFFLFQLMLKLRRMGGKVLRCLQKGRVFRRWLKYIRPAYTIQEASQNDLVALYAWLSPDGEFTLPESERNAHPGLINYVARRGDQVLGFVRLIRHPETDAPYTGYWLYSLTVRARYRGMGIGEALTQRVIEQSRIERVPELCLCVFEDNVPAIAMYRKLGFEQVSLPAVEEALADDVELYGRQRVPFKKLL